MIVTTKEYTLNTTLSTLTEIKTGISYSVNKNSLSDLLDGSKTYRKLMMEGKITKK